MEPAYYPPSSTFLTDSPISLFPNPSASQTAFTAMREGAHKHHMAVIQSVLESDPIKEFNAAKEALVNKEGTAHSQSAINQSDFPPFQVVKAPNPNRPQQQADLTSTSDTSPSSPCSPQASNFIAAGSSTSQRNMALMLLSPPLMEKLEADLIMLQEKYGLISQALTPAPAPARMPHRDSNSVQSDLLSSKLAAMGTFASPLRLNTVSTPKAIRSEAFLDQDMGSASTFHSPNIRSNSSAQAQKQIRGNHQPKVQFVESTAAMRGNAPLLSSALPTASLHNCAAPSVQSCEVPVPVRGIAPPTAGIALPTAGIAPPTAGNALSTAGIAPSTAGNALSTAGIAPPTAVNAQSTAGNAPSTAGNAPFYSYAPPTVRGNAPLLNSAYQCYEPARGTSWAARLGGSRSTSSTALTYIPPTLVAGGTIAGVAVACRASYLRRVLASRLSIQTCGHF